MKYLKKITIFQLGLIPATLVAGPAVAEINLFLLSIINIFFFYKNKDTFLIKKYLKLIYLFIIFYTTLILTSVLSEFIFYSLKNSLAYIRLGFYSFAIFYTLKNINNDNKKTIYSLFSITLCFLSIDAIIQFYFKQNIIGFVSIYENQRISGMFNEEYVLGSFLQKMVPIFLFLTFLYNREVKITQLLVISLIYLAIFISGERSAFFLVSLFFLILIFTNHYIRKKIIIIISIFIIFVPFTLYQNFKLIERYSSIYSQVFDPDRFWEKKFIKENNSEVTNEIEVHKNNKGFYFFSFHHEMTFKSALKMFISNPILGVGVKNFRKNCSQFSDNKYGCSTHPHNTYIQLLSETGIIGFSFILFLFLNLTVKLFKYIKKNFLNKNKDNYWVILNIGFIINLWPFIPTGNFFNNWLSMIYFVLIGFYIYSKDTVPNE